MQFSDIHSNVIYSFYDELSVKISFNWFFTARDPHKKINFFQVNS